MASHLEARFKLQWRAVAGPSLDEEFRFHPVRKWRADFCHAESMTLIEVEGGHWIGQSGAVDPKTGKPKKGRHTSGAGFENDCEEYLEAALLGFKVIRLVEKQLVPETLARIARHCERYVRDDDELLAMLDD